MSDIIAASGTYDGTSYRLRVVTDGEIIAHNSDTSKYIHTTISGIGTKDFYNSACCVTRLNGRSTVTATLICTATYWWAWEYYDTSSQTWNIMQGGYNSNISQNGLYARTWDAGYTDRYYYYNANSFGGSQNFSLSSDILTVFTNLDDYNNYIQTVAPPTYNWISVDAVVGKNGRSNFTQLEYSTDGNPVTGASSSAFSNIEYSTSVKNLVPLPVYGEWVDAIWSGDQNVLRIKWNSSTNFDVQLAIGSISGQPAISFNYSLNSANDDAFIMLLTDVQGESTYLMRPSIVLYDSSTQTFSYNTETVTDAQAETLYNWLVFNYDGDSVFGPPNEGGGGDRGNPIIEDAVGRPTLPTLSALDTGWTKMYLFNGSDAVTRLKALADWMDDFWENFINYIFKDDPMQALIAVCASPISIPTLNQSDNQHVYFLGEDTNIMAKLISEQYFIVECGECLIDYPSNHTYLDFAPYTKVKAVLPFVGTIDLNTDDIMGRKIKLEYICDALTGTCIACIYVYTDKGWSMHYQKDGTFLVQIPFTKTDYTQQIGAIINAVSTLAIAGISLGAGANLRQMGEIGKSSAAHMALSAGSNAINSGISMLMSHPTYNYMAGSSNGVASYMGLDTPYLLIERPTLARPRDDEKFIGMPSYITDVVGNFSGFTKFIEVHLEDCFCTSEEYKDIMNNLLSGVIINSDGSPTPTPTPSSGNSAIVFIKNKSERNVIGKKWTTTYIIEGKLVYDQSIETPKFLISGDVKEYNYAYIPLFNRFYFIDDIVCSRQNLEEVHFTVDALQSFQNEIKASEGVAGRSSDRNNFYINDDALMVQQNLKVQTVQFKKNGVKFKFNKADSCYVVVLSNVNSHGST